MSLSVYNTDWISSDYESDRSLLVKVFENAPLFNGAIRVPRAEFDGVVSIAIGYGYDLIKHEPDEIDDDLVAIGLPQLSSHDVALLELAKPLSEKLHALNDLGKNISPEAAQEKQGLIAELKSIAGRISLSLIDEQHASDLLKIVMTEFEAKFDADVASVYGFSIPPSRERAALISMAYNAGTASTLFHEKDRLGNIIGASGLTSALINDDRARAWYEIRYGSAKGVRGLVRRRFSEAHLFGLYSSPDNVSVQDALGAYRMFSDSGIRENIASYERKWGADIYASNTQAHYYVNGSATIDRELRAAADIIIEKYIPASEGPAGIGVLDIYVGDDVDYYVRGEIKYSKNDLLIGNERNNLFIGGKGNDLLQGGAGNDIYVFESGWGTDVITKFKGSVSFNSYLLK